jgi:hypothetical protein
MTQTQASTTNRFSERVAISGTDALYSGVIVTALGFLGPMPMVCTAEYTMRPVQSSDTPRTYSREEVRAAVDRLINAPIVTAESAARNEAAFQEILRQHGVAPRITSPVSVRQRTT